MVESTVIFVLKTKEKKKKVMLFCMFLSFLYPTKFYTLIFFIKEIIITNKARHLLAKGIQKTTCT